MPPPGSPDLGAARDLPPVELTFDSTPLTPADLTGAKFTAPRPGLYRVSTTPPAPDLDGDAPDDDEIPSIGRALAALLGLVMFLILACVAAGLLFVVLI